MDLGLRVLSTVGRKSVFILVRILDLGLVIYSKQKENIHSSLDFGHFVLSDFCLSISVRILDYSREKRIFLLLEFGFRYRV